MKRFLKLMICILFLGLVLNSCKPGGTDDPIPDPIIPPVKVDKRVTMSTIKIISDQSIIAGIEDTLVIKGKNFGKTLGYVSFIKDGVGTYMTPTECQKFKYYTWSDTQIVMEMPSCAYSGKVKIFGSTTQISTSILNIKANVGTYETPGPTYKYKPLTNQDGGGYVFYVNYIYFNNDTILKAIEAVFKELRSKTGVNYRLDKLPSDRTCQTDDYSVIAPYNTSIHGSGVVGFCDVSFGYCGTSDPFRKGIDMQMSNTAKWYYGSGKAPAGKVKFRYVLLHEMLHSIGLQHVEISNQTMNPIVTGSPADSWNSTDVMTSEEVTAAKFMVRISQKPWNCSTWTMQMLPLKSAPDQVYNP